MENDKRLYAFHSRVSLLVYFVLARSESDAVNLWTDAIISRGLVSNKDNIPDFKVLEVTEFIQ